MALARWQANIVDDVGNIQAGASVEVRDENAGGSLAAIYSDRAGATPIANPFTADSEGFAAFHALGSAYKITATKGSFSRIWRYVGISTSQELDKEALLVGLNNRGNWSVSSIIYAANDEVQWNGSSYICILGNTSAATSEPGVGATWATYWAILAKRGGSDPTWLFDTSTTASDPGTGKFRLNNATVASATAMYFNELCNDNGNPSMATWLQTWDDATNLNFRGYIIIRKTLNPGTFAIFRVNAAITDNGTWDTIPVAFVQGNGTFSASDEIAVAFERGPDAPLVSLTQQFDSSSTTMADPGNGLFRMNNGTIGSVTQIALDDLTTSALDISNFVITWANSSSVTKGYVIFQRQDSNGAAISCIFSVQSLVDNAGWTQLNVTYITGVLPTNGSPHSIIFVRTGDRGSPAGLRWQYDSTTAMADPGSGKFRLDNATMASAANIALSYNLNETGNPSAGAFVKTWDDSTSTALRGYIIVKDVNNPQTYAIYSVGAVTDNTTWLQIPLTFINGNGAFTNTSSFAIEFSRTGDLGASGPAVGFPITGASIANNDLLIFGDVSAANVNRQDTVANAVAAGGAGVFAKVPAVNGQTASYTLVLTDADAIIRMGVAGANNLTVPPQSSVAWVAGTIIPVIQSLAGITSIVAGAGVTIQSYGSKLRLIGQYASCVLMRTSTSDTWTVCGSLQV